MKTRDTIQSQGLAAINGKSRAGLVISQRIGKTRIGLKDMLRQFTPTSKFLVVAPFTTIHDSWRNEASEIHAEFLLDHIIFTTYRSISKHGFDIDTMYLDECQSLLPSHNEYLKDYIAQGGRTIGMTGTYPVGTKSAKARMCKYYCPPVMTYLTDDAVDDKILNDYEIIVHLLKLTKQKVVKKEGRNGVWMNSEQGEYTYWDDAIAEKEDPTEIKKMRITMMKSMQEFPTKMKYAQVLLNEQTDKTLVFVETKKQADEICPHSVHSSNPNSKANLYAFQAGDITQLSAVKQLSMGVTIPDLRVIIITHSYANNTQTAQRLARSLNLQPHEKSTIHILCYEDTIDKWWVTAALKQFDPNKITWRKAKFQQGIHYRF